MTIHFRPLEPYARPAVGENLSTGRVTLTLPGVGGTNEYHELDIDEAERTATRLIDWHEFHFTDAISHDEYDVAMNHADDAWTGQRLRDAASAVRVFTITHGRRP